MLNRDKLLAKRDKYLNDWFNSLDTLIKDGIFNSDVDMTELRELDGMEYEQYLDSLEENR